MMNPVFFKSQDEFRKWLELHHATEKEILVGFYKVKSGKLNMTWSQSVDEALCLGWIDGIRRSIDEESYCIRFTPRKPSSTWSKVNIKKVEELMKKGLMTQPGIEAFNFRKKSNSGVYGFENESAVLNESFEKEFRGNKNAWDFFKKQAPSYQKTILQWIMVAKQEKTRLNRLNKTISESEKQNRIY